MLSDTCNRDCSYPAYAREQIRDQSLTLCGAFVQLPFCLSRCPYIMVLPKLIYPWIKESNPIQKLGIFLNALISRIPLDFPYPKRHQGNHQMHIRLSALIPTKSCIRIPGCQPPMNRVKWCIRSNKIKPSLSCPLLPRPAAIASQHRFINLAKIASIQHRMMYALYCKIVPLGIDSNNPPHQWRLYLYLPI